MLKIRRLTPQDLKFVWENTGRENWGYLEVDILRCYLLEPKGCFLAEVNDERVGHVFTVSYGNIGWIGLLIVRPEYRGKGIGTKLTEKAISHLKKLNVKAVRLEAVVEAVSLYKKLGLSPEFESLRLFKKLENEDNCRENVDSSPIQRVREKDLSRIAKFDEKYFGANRLKVLKALYREYPHLSFLAVKNHKIAGYLMARRASRGYWIGPWVCKLGLSGTAEKLLLLCINTIKEEAGTAEVRLGTPAVNTSAVELLKSLGFSTYSKSLRMLLGEKTLQESTEGVYGIGGPEKG